MVKEHMERKKEDHLKNQKKVKKGNNNAKVR